jgi:RNase P subunit RPR2
MPEVDPALIRFEPGQMRLFTCKDMTLLVRADMAELPCPRCDRPLAAAVNSEMSERIKMDGITWLCECGWREE